MKWYLEEAQKTQRALAIQSAIKPSNRISNRIGSVYLVIDCSGSMEGTKIIQAREGALNFARDALKKGYFTGLIQFHSATSHICEPQHDVSMIEGYLKKLEIGNLTHMADAIRMGYLQLKGRPGAKVMVIITDGMPNGPGDPGSTFKERDAALKDGIDIIAIGTDDADQKFLKKLASRTELGIKVSQENLGQTIATSGSLLPVVIENNREKRTAH